MRQKFHIMQGLYCLSMQQKTEHVTACLQKLEAGHYLYQALATFPKQFDAIVVMFIRIGELSGRLAQTIQCAIHYLEFKQIMAEKSQKYLLYPVLLLSVLFGVLYSFVHIIIPQFESAHIALDIGYLRMIYFFLNIVLIVFVVLISFLVLRVVSPWVAQKTGSWLFRVPVFGGLYYKLQSGYFLKILSILLAEKVPAVWALESLQHEIPFERIKKQYHACSVALHAGCSVPTALENLEIVKKTMVVVEGDSWLDRLDDIAETQLQSAQERMSLVIRMVEPLVVLFTGSILVMIILIIFLPLYEHLHVMV